jgi:hypothetical protein
VRLVSGAVTCVPLANADHPCVKDIVRTVHYAYTGLHGCRNWMKERYHRNLNYAVGKPPVSKGLMYSYLSGASFWGVSARSDGNLLTYQRSVSPPCPRAKRTLAWAWSWRQYVRPDYTVSLSRRHSSYSYRYTNLKSQTYSKKDVLICCELLLRGKSTFTWMASLRLSQFFVICWLWTDI